MFGKARHTLATLEEAARAAAVQPQSTARSHFAAVDAARTPRMDRQVIATVRSALQLRRGVTVELTDGQTLPLSLNSSPDWYATQRIRISSGEQHLELMAAHTSRSTFAISTLDQCPICAADTPGRCITDLRDFGAWLLGTSERLRLPDVLARHRRQCPHWTIPYWLA